MQRKRGQLLEASVKLETAAIMPLGTMCVEKSNKVSLHEANCIF